MVSMLVAEANERGTKKSKRSRHRILTLHHYLYLHLTSCWTSWICKSVVYWIYSVSSDDDNGDGGGIIDSILVLQSNCPLS